MRGVVILDQDCLTRRNEYSVATFSFIFRLKKERFFTIQQFHKKHVPTQVMILKEIAPL